MFNNNKLATDLFEQVNNLNNLPNHAVEIEHARLRFTIRLGANLCMLR